MGDNILTIEVLLNIALVMEFGAAMAVARKHPFLANTIWCVANPIFLAHAIYLNDLQLIILFTLYQIISIYGIIYLYYKNRRNK